MTVIAAVRVFDVPVLIGDLLITDERVHPSLLIPSRIHDEMPILRRRVSDMRRKCFILNDHFAVGFTGHVQAGKRIIDELDRNFGNSIRGPTISELDAALHPFTFNLNGLDGQVIGWTVPGSDPVCFEFKAKLLHKAREVDKSVVGSGGKIFTGYLSNSRLFTNTKPGVSPHGQATRQAVWIMGHTMFEEAHSGEHLTSSFGGGIEIAVWDGHRFAFIRKVGFLHWNVWIRDSKVIVEPAGLKVFYEDHGGYSILAAYRMGGIRGANTNTVFTRPLACYLYGILPLNYTEKFSHSLITEPSSECDYYFAGFAIINEDVKQNAFLGVSVAKDEEEFLTIRPYEDAENISINKQHLIDVLRDMFPGVIED